MSKTETCDVVVCGGGIGGGALATGLARRGLHVMMLEPQEEYRELSRGEMLSPWGTADAVRFGVGDCIHATNPAPLTQWGKWDEVFEPDEAPIDDITPKAPGFGPALAIHHYRVCRSFARGAADAGAEVAMGAQNIAVTPGAPPTVTFDHYGAARVVQPRLVVGAGGRAMPLARRLGLEMTYYVDHWGGALEVEGMEEWPLGLQAMGKQDDRNFMVFPQGDGNARLYLNCPASLGKTFVGPRRTQRFHAVYDLSCLPESLREMLVASRPVGEAVGGPARVYTVERPFAEGVVLIGDEAGENDTVIGTGLSTALRDARMLGERLLDERDWTIDLFAAFHDERRVRLAQLTFVADLMVRIYCDFAPDAQERRSVVLRRLQQNRNFQAPLGAMVTGPDRVPDFAYSEFLLERLFATESTVRRRRMALIG